MAQSEGQSSTTSELRRLQLGHEGVRLVLCSKINEAEDLFKKTRFVLVIYCMARWISRVFAHVVQCVKQCMCVCIVGLKDHNYMLDTVQLYFW